MGQVPPQLPCSRRPSVWEEFMSEVAIPQPTSSVRKPSWSAKFFEIWWFRIPHGLRRYSTVLSLAWSDGTYLTAWPRLATVLPIAVFAFGLLEGATHFAFLWIARGPEFTTQKNAKCVAPSSR